jgi:hypothetical protein
MENIDLLVLTSIATVSFIIFIVGSIREFTKIAKEEIDYHKYKSPVVGRDLLYNLVAKLAKSDEFTTEEVVGVLDRTISDMETDGLYFSDEIKSILESNREKLTCNYSQLPSAKSYQYSE